MTETPTPETFDIDAWLTDASLHEESVRIYKRGDVISELGKLREEIEDQQAVVGKSLTDTERMMDLRERYDKLLETFGASALTIYCRAVPRSILRAIQEQNEARATAEKWDKATAGREFIYSMLAESIVGVNSPDQPRQPAKFSPKSIKRLEEECGSAEFQGVWQTYLKADTKLEEPDTDFLQKSSGDSKDDIDA